MLVKRLPFKIGYGERQERRPKDKEKEQKYVAAGWGPGWGNLWEVPESWDVRGFQESMGMTLAKCQTVGRWDMKKPLPVDRD